MPLIPCQTNSNPSASLYAPAGSGSGPGPIGPNPVVSSLTAADFVSSASLFCSTINGVVIGSASIPTDGISTNQVAAASGGTLSLFGGDVATSITLDSSKSNITLLSASGTGNINLNAYSTIVQYDLNVSSINGQAPGAAVGTDIGVSSLQINSAGSLSLRFESPDDEKNLYSASIKFDHDSVPNVTTRLLYDSTDGVSSLAIYRELGGLAPGTLQVAELNGVSSINGQAPFGSAGPNPVVSSISFPLGNATTGGVINMLSNLSINDSSTPVLQDYQFYTNLQNVGGGLWENISSFVSSPNVFQVNGTGGDGANGILAVIGGADGRNAIAATNGFGTPSTLTLVADPVVIPGNLQVSSINGAAPGGGGLQFSTIGIPGGSGASSFALVANQTNTLVEFSTLAGHVYQASVVARGLLSADPTDTDILLSEIIDNATGNEVLGSWPMSQVSTFTSGGIQQQVGGSVTWKAGGTGAFFSLYPTVDAAARVDSISLIDFGAI